jgi:hypothetical protein
MPDDVGYLKYKKQVHELEVGKAMYDWYTGQELLLNQMRQVVAYAFMRFFDLLGMDPWQGAKVTHMGKKPCYVDLQDKMPKGDSKRTPKPHIPKIIETTLGFEKFLLVWDRWGVKPDLKGLGKVLTHYSEWDVSDCSELVRVWGGIVEEVGASASKATTAIKQKKTHEWTGLDAAREVAERLDDIRKRAKGQSAGFDGLTEKSPSRLHGLRDAHQKWTAPETGVRERVKYLTQEREIPQWMRSYVYKGQEAKGLVRGCSLLKPVNASLVKHLDSVFGLWEGADISGTTTDFIGCFEAVWMMTFESILAEKNSPEELNEMLEVATWCAPYFALLAPSAMVYGYHHTMYEIAVALSMAYGTDKGDKKDPVFDYYIGWYDSLVPKISHVGSQKGGHGLFSRGVGFLKKENREAKWTVGAAKSKGKEATLNQSLVAAIKKVETKAKKIDDNPFVIALVDRAGVVYGGYLLDKQDAESKKNLFHAVHCHDIALKKGADGLSRDLLSKLSPGYMNELAGKSKGGESYYERYR